MPISTCLPGPSKHAGPADAARAAGRRPAVTSARAPTRRLPAARRTVAGRGPRGLRGRGRRRVSAQAAPEAYVPGKELDTSEEITHSLDRKLPTSRTPRLPRPGWARRRECRTRLQASRRMPRQPRAAGRQTTGSGVRFTDQADAAGLHFVHFDGRRSSQLPEDMGSGLAWGDYDGDGYPDLFVVNESGPLTLTPTEVETLSRPRTPLPQQRQRHVHRRDRLGRSRRARLGDGRRVGRLRR